MASIGIFGGTFNPVHSGHLMIAQDACDAYSLDRVLFIPCSTPPHKHVENMPENRHRLEMLRLATAGDDRFEVDSCELDREGISYSIDTVRLLKARYPDDSLYFIIGSDSLVELHLWRDIGSLVELCTFITVPRPGITEADLSEKSIQLPDPWPGRLLEHVVQGHPLAISSTGIRKRIAEGLSCSYLVPDFVCDYIQENGLYTHD